MTKKKRHSLLQCHNDMGNVGVDDTAMLQRQKTTLMDGAIDATILAPWYYDKDKGDGCYNDKDNVKTDEAARLRRQRPC